MFNILGEFKTFFNTLVACAALFDLGPPHDISP